jgi:quercetin dioxygenase-like cupin family protein
MTALDPQTTPATTPHSGGGGARSRIHVPPGEGRHLPMIDGDHVAKATVRDTAGTFEVFEVFAPARSMAPPHVSPWSGVLYLVEGRVTVLVGDTTYDVEPGGVVLCPAGTPCSFEVRGESARFLAVTSGGGAGQFFADFASSVPTDRPVEESLEAILAVTERHGVRLAGR